MDQELNLKLALAEELSELLIITPYKVGYEPWLCWKEGKEVTPREWDWIVRECEKKLTWEQWNRYFSEFPMNCQAAVRNTFQSTWQQRAIAYFKTIGKEI